MPQLKQETKEIASAHKAITDQDRQMASTASSLFKEKKYDACLQHMKKLSEQRPHDLHVTANKAVLDYRQNMLLCVCIQKHCCIKQNGKFCWFCFWLNHAKICFSDFHSVININNYYYIYFEFSA